MFAAPRSLVLLACLLLLSGRVRAGQEAYPVTKEGWIERLARIQTPIGEDYGAMYHLAQGDDEMIYQVVRDGWSRFPGDSVKTYMLSRVVDARDPPPADAAGHRPPEPAPNPHLLELLDLGMRDPKPDPSYTARHYLFGIAFQDFYDRPKEYQAWYRDARGKPVEQVVREGMTDYIARLDHADAQTRRRLLEMAAEAPFKSGLSTTTDVQGKVITTIQTTGLTGIRRRLALETGLLDHWIRAAQSEADLDTAAAAALNVLNFMPGHAFLKANQATLRTILSRVAENPKSNYYGASGQFLGAFDEKWAVDLLIKRMLSDFPTDGLGGLLTALSEVRDPRVIPTLIALLETGELESWHEQMVISALQRLGGPSARKNTAGWRDWWRAHAAELPAEVRAMPIPHIVSIAEKANTVMLRRQTVEVHIDGDSRRAYRLLTPGLLLPRAAQPVPASATESRYFVALRDRPGLIVVLSDTDPNDGQVQEFWVKSLTRAFSGRYLVALAMAPRWGQEAPYTWVTMANRAKSPKATFTVETFVAQIAADVMARYPIRPDRVFLHGEGRAGLAAYSCSLQDVTPFHGFSLLAPEFRTAELPPLTAARRRRYYIQAAQGQKTPPYFLATSAMALLSRAGAAVGLNPIPGDHAPRFSLDTLPLLEKAVTWLEQAR